MFQPCTSHEQASPVFHSAERLKGTAKWRWRSDYYRLHGFIYGAKDNGLVFCLDTSKVIEIPNKLRLEKAVVAGKP